MLSSIISLFEHKIRPLIDAGFSNAEIDEATFDKLIEPIHQAIVRYSDIATTEDVSGMLYYLTGKCHIVWGE